MLLKVCGTAHPGSESGTCFHSNRSCQLAPAHEGMKIRLRWLAGILYGGSGLGSASGLPGAGDKPQRYIFAGQLGRTLTLAINIADVARHRTGTIFVPMTKWGAGITMALRMPHEEDENGGTRRSICNWGHELAVLSGLTLTSILFPSRERLLKARFAFLRGSRARLFS